MKCIDLKWLTSFYQILNNTTDILYVYKQSIATAEIIFYVDIPRAAYPSSIARRPDRGR